MDRFDYKMLQPYRRTMGNESEAALITAIFDGVAETPLWSTFLARLREMTGARYATMILKPPARRMDEALQLLSGATSSFQFENFFKDEAAPSPATPAQRDGMLYTLDELFGIYTPFEIQYYRRLLADHDIKNIRQMRLREKSGVDAWLTISNSGMDFTPEHEALVCKIAPTLRGVLQLYVSMERERYSASLTANAVRRLQFGWIALDHDGRIIECDEHGGLVLSESMALGRSPSGKLTAASQEIEREIHAALRYIVHHPASRARAFTLNREPWLEMLLVPAGRSAATSIKAASAVAYVHGDNWQSAVRHEHLGELFGLLPHESRLALAVSRGMTLSEAAAEFGLTLSSARTYSKSIYSKTGARGMPDLVRIIMRSVMAISPHG